MKAFTAVLSIGAMLGIALGTPIHIGDTAVERRDVEVDNADEQVFPFPTIPYLPLPPSLAPVPTLPIPTLPTLALPTLALPTLPSLVLPTPPVLPPLPTLAPIPIPTTPDDLISALRIALTQIINILTAIRSTIPDTNGLPPLPPLPPLPTLPAIPISPPALPTSIPGLPTTPNALLTQLAQLQAPLGALQTIFSNPPAGTTPDQLKDALAILEQIQAQTTPVVTRIFSLVGSGALPLQGNPANLDAVTAALGAVVSYFLSIFGLLPGLGALGSFS